MSTKDIISGCLELNIIISHYGYAHSSPSLVLFQHEKGDLYYRYTSEASNYINTPSYRYCVKTHAHCMIPVVQYWYLYRYGINERRCGRLSSIIWSFQGSHFRVLKKDTFLSLTLSGKS